MHKIKINNWQKVLGLILTMSMTFSLSAAPLKIMMLGDSITEGGGDIPDTPEQNQSTYTQGLFTTPDNIAYRAKLYDLLETDGYTFGGSNADLDFVGNRSGGSNYGTFDQHHEGHSGYRSDQIRDGIDGWLSTSPADIVLLHIGTNDGAQSLPIGSYDDVNESNNTTVNNVKKILNTIFIKNPNSKVFVARIIEARRTEAWSSWRTDTLNNKIEEMIVHHIETANIKMVNMQNGAGLEYDIAGTTNGDMQAYEIHPNGNIYYDFHPNVNGYEKMAAKWHSELMASGWLPTLGGDTTVPVISLNGSTTVTLTVGDTYADAGATANDDTDGDITINILTVNPVDTNTAGTYLITYDVNDTAGNQAAQVTRAVTVNKSSVGDVTAPTITLNGSTTIDLAVGDVYREEGATAHDNIDGDISENIDIGINNLNTSVVGSYTVIYNVSDIAGNAANQVSRTVHVKASANNKEWYNYDKVGNIATVIPIGDFEQSILAVKDGLETIFDVGGNSISLKHSFGTGKYAYILATENGEVETGFKNAVAKDSTLKVNTSFKAGTNSVMKQSTIGKIMIESSVKLMKNESFIIGGK